MSRHLYAIHDYDPAWTALVRSAGKTAWVVETMGIGDDPNDQRGEDFSGRAAEGVTPIVRLNFSHHGQGTIPLPNRYNEFAIRCGNFVRASKGCTHFIIGNEPNLAGERPQGVPIFSADYARCFALCRQRIKEVGLVHTVIVAPVAPYNVDSGSWIEYWSNILRLIGAEADGLALHTYSRGGGLQSVTSKAKMESPYDAYYNGFLAYRDLLEEVPAPLRGLPVYITETDQNGPWADENSGWVKAAYKEIDDWNKKAGTQKIFCLALYRWYDYDKWNISKKKSVVDDFSQTLKETNYLVPTITNLPDAGNEGVVGEVTSPAGANLRSGPGLNYSVVTVMPIGMKLKVVGRSGDSSWWQVETSKFGKVWVSNSVVKVSGTGSVPVITVTVPLPSPQIIDKQWLINSWSRVLSIDPLLVKAVLIIESAGNSFENGRMIIRFENHIFRSQLVKLAPQLETSFHVHFRYSSPVWTGHEWRPTASAPWNKQHDGGQEEEWVVFNFARNLHETAAMQSISMGAAQVMGFNFSTVGYNSVQAMFNDYANISLGEVNQLTGFFAYVFNTSGLLEGFRKKDFAMIAKGYNGQGGISRYAPMIKNKYIELGGQV